MAELGAVASVLQVAQFGAQLSLTLYNVAQTVKTASQDVKRIAKEIALFAQVLKDLGSALERGQGSKLYRGDAYETSRMIVEECEGVFKEIEEILFKRTTKESKAFDAALSIPKAERFLWVFRKGRVQLLRSNLESLKSTISLKLAVLTYADKHTSSIKRSDDADDVLSLKSLVLANETATGELRELTTSTPKGPEGSGSEHIWSPGPIATHGIWNLSPTGKPMGSPFKGDVLTPTTTPEPAASLVTPNLNMIPRLTHYNGEPKSPLLTSTELSSATELTFSSSVSPKVSAKSSIENTAGSQESAEYQRRIWGDLDKLELAVKKLDIAIWELKRIEKNMKLGLPLQYAEQQSSLLIRLKDGLGHFGLSTEQIGWAMNRLVNPNIYLGQRTEISQTISKFDVDLTELQEHGIIFATAQGNHDLLDIQRWLPSYFEDILWSHMKQKIHDMQGLSKPEPVRYMPTLFEVRKTGGKRFHACNDPGCEKVFTNAEHLRRHKLNHSPEPYQCGIAGCQKSFHRPDLLARHMERQHNDPESRDYRHEHSLSQVLMAESDTVPTIMTTTVPPLSPNTMLEPATQPFSVMSIYSIVDHNTPPGFVNQPMGTLNNLSQLPVPTGPHGFAPNSVYEATTSDDSQFYSADSCYSHNFEYPQASAKRKRKNTQIGDSENAMPPYESMAYGSPIQSSRGTCSRQISSTERSPPQKLRRTMKKRVVNDNAESNVDAEAKEATEEATEEAPRVDPDQAVKNLLRKWTTLLDMLLRPGYAK